MSVWFPLPETKFSGVERKICYLRGEGEGLYWCKTWKKKKSLFFSKAPKHTAKSYKELHWWWEDCVTLHDTGLFMDLRWEHYLWSVVTPGCCDFSGKTPMTPEGEQHWTWEPVSRIRSAGCPVCYWISGSAEFQVLWKNMLSVKYSNSRAVSCNQDIK